MTTPKPKNHRSKTGGREPWSKGISLFPFRFSNKVRVATTAHRIRRGGRQSRRKPVPIQNICRTASPKTASQAVRTHRWTEGRPRTPPTPRPDFKVIQRAQIPQLQPPKIVPKRRKAAGQAGADPKRKRSRARIQEPPSNEIREKKNAKTKIAQARAAQRTQREVDRFSAAGTFFKMRPSGCPKGLNQSDVTPYLVVNIGCRAPWQLGAWRDYLNPGVLLSVSP